MSNKTESLQLPRRTSPDVTDRCKRGCAAFKWRVTGSKVRSQLAFLFFLNWHMSHSASPFPSAPCVRVQHIDAHVHWRAGNKKSQLQANLVQGPKTLAYSITQKLNCFIFLIFREREKVEGGAMRGQVRWSQVYFADGRGIPILYIRKKFAQI